VNWCCAGLVGPAAQRFPMAGLSLKVTLNNFIDSELDQLLRRSGGVLLLGCRFLTILRTR
jgi:hypothetical protein